MRKAKKNPTEAEAMMAAHLNDSVALCDFLSLMAEEVSTNIFYLLISVSKS